MDCAYGKIDEVSTENGVGEMNLLERRPSKYLFSGSGFAREMSGNFHTSLTLTVFAAYYGTATLFKELSYDCARTRF